MDSSSKPVAKSHSTHQTDVNGLDDGMASTLNPLDLQKFLAYTLFLCKKQREPPLYSAEAQVYVLDEKCESGSPWMETSTRSVAVHLYHDVNRRSFRIISVEGSKPILNATISSSVRLKKASSKFLQWADSKNNYIYGLGFVSEKEMSKFADKVGQIQEMADKTYADEFHPRPPSETMENFLDEEANISGSDQMIKLENERLKAALAQSSINAKKWEDEMTALKTMNQELTEALNKSRASALRASNVDEPWSSPDLEGVLRQLTASLGPSGAAEDGQERESRRPEEILEDVQAVINLNRDLQRGLQEQETISKAFKSSVSSLNEQIGLKLKELMSLHEKLSAHLRAS